MAKAAVEVQGINALARALKKAGDTGLGDALKASHREGAEIVAKAARPRVPRDSGDLAASLRTGSTPRSGRVSIGKKKVPYAPPIHFGWVRRNIRPNTFLYTALDRRKEEVEDAFLAAIEALSENVVDEVNQHGG